MKCISSLKRKGSELERMLNLGVMLKVDYPIPWCAGMVVVPKKTGAVRYTPYQLWMTH